MTDESGMAYPLHIDTLLDNAIGRRGLLRRVHREHAHRHGRHPGRRPSSSRGSGARRPGGLGSSDADVARRAQRLVVRGSGLGAARSRSRSTSARGPTGCRRCCRPTVRRGRSTPDARRRTVHHRDDQGHRVRGLRRGRRLVRRHLHSSTTKAPTISNVAAVGRWRRHRHDLLDDGRSVGHRGAATARRRAWDRPPARLARQLSTPSRSTGLHAERHISLPRLLDRRERQHGRVADALRARPRLTHAGRVADRHQPWPTSGPAPSAHTYLADESGGEVILAPTVGAEFGGSSLPAGWTARDLGRGGLPAASPWLRRQPDASTATSLAPTRSSAPGRALEFVADLQRRDLPARRPRGRPQLRAALGHVQHRRHRRTSCTRASSWLRQSPTHRCLGIASLGRLRTAIALNGGASSVRFLVDGALVAHLRRAPCPGTLRPIASDFGSGRWRSWPSTGCACRPIRRPAASPRACSMPAAPVGWQQLTADELHPGQYLRWASKCAAATWPRPMAAGAASCRSLGGAFSLTGRYLQYRATLQTTDSGLSPTLRSVTVSYGAAP